MFKSEYSSSATAGNSRGGAARTATLEASRDPFGAAPITPAADLPPRDWCVRTGDLPEEISLPAAFEAVAEQSPRATALVEGERTLTYEELNVRANQLAWWLRARGIGRGARVALATGRSVELVVAQLAILKAGATYVPLDVNHPADRLSFLLENCGARLLLTRSREAPRLRALAAEVVLLDEPALFAGAARVNPHAGVTGRDIAYIGYTSGTTGRPKGSLIAHRGVLRLARGQDCVTLDATRRFLALSSPAFDGITFDVWTPLLSGGTCVIFPDRWPEPARLEAVIRGHGVTTLFITTSLFNQIIDLQPSALATTREVVIGGEALSVAHIRRAMTALPGVQLINGYGPTECTAFACGYRIPRPEAWGCATVPIGPPLNHTECWIVDDSGQPAQIGAAGELWLGGAGLAQGYLDQPELTAEKFVPHPWSSDPDAKLYRTGDLARWLPTGAIEYLGRTDDQIKLRGFRIELGEIEAVAREIAGVANAAVVVRLLPSGSRQLVAAVSLLAGAQVGEEQVWAHFRRRLPREMVPGALRFVERLPLAETGKIDRRAVRELFAAEAPAAVATAAPQSADALEARLVRAWRRILQQARLDARSDFFAAGGDSLQAVQLAVELQAQLDRQIAASLIHSYPTPAALAAFLRSEESLVAGTTPKIEGAGDGPLIVYVPGVYGFVRLPAGIRAGLQGRHRYFDHLQSPGLDGTQPPLENVPELAAEMIRQLTAVYPSGELRLYGYSFGGLLAYEMACQLAARRRRVDRLIIGDASPCHAHRWRGPWERTALRCADLFRPPLHRLPQKLATLARVAFPHAPGTWGIEKQTPLVAASVRAFIQYRPGPYVGRMALIRCTRPEFSPFWAFPTQPDYGWSEWVQGPLTVHPVDCAHAEIIPGRVDPEILAVLTQP